MKRDDDEETDKRTMKRKQTMMKAGGSSEPNKPTNPIKPARDLHANAKARKGAQPGLEASKASA